MLVVAVAGVVQVFVIPRRVSVPTFGAYRLFLLYAGFAGLLHFGLVDGAFLRWAGASPARIASEWRRVVVTLLAIGTALLALVVVASRFAFPFSTPDGRMVAVAVVACALAVNSVTLAGYALQAAGDFRKAGFIAALGPSSFTLVVLALPLRSLSSLLAAYVASFGVAAMVGAWLVATLAPGAPRGASRGASGGDRTQPSARDLAESGLPVLGANLAAGLSQFADRLLVSFVVPVSTFALYGFASATMVAASTATQTLSRVALSHAARRSARGGDRAIFLDAFHDVIAAAFGVTIAGLPIFEDIVHRILPAYVDALPIVRALVLGAPFAIALHVVLVGTLQSHGFVRRQLAIELGALVVVVACCAPLLAAHRPLTDVAAASAIAAFVGWSLAVIVVRRIVDGAAPHATRFAATALLQGAALVAALAMAGTTPARVALYAALSVVPTGLAARRAWSRA